MDYLDRIRDLSIQKRALLERQLLKKITAVPHPATIPRRDPSCPCPLSHAQERVWFLEQMHPGVPAYSEAEAVHMEGALNVESLEEALNHIIARHEVLRTSIQVIDRKPIQVIYESRPLKIARMDLSDRPEDHRQTELDRLLIQEYRRPFSLSHDPLVRASLIRLSRVNHVFVLVLHHIVCDRWSMGVLFHELSVLYNALSLGKFPPLPPLPIQYGDFSQWQRQRLQDKVIKKDLSYWKEQLCGTPDLMALPTDRPRPRVISYQGSKEFFQINLSSTGNLHCLSQREGISLFTVLAAAFKTLLYRYTGQQDILLGIPIADRDQPEMEPLIGPLVDTVVLRTDLSGEPTFRELLRMVHEAMLGAYAHRALSFEKLVDKLRPERSLSHMPLFQVMLNWRDRDAQMRFMELEGLTLSPLATHNGTSKFDIGLTLTEDADGLLGELEYSTDLFDPSTIRNLIGHYRTLLEEIVVNPGEKTFAFPMFTEEECQQLLVEWNNTTTAYPHDQCLHQLFEAQVERVPEAIAVVFEDQALSYAELNARANQLAHHLRQLGVGPEVLVGVCMERSLEMVIGLLGILKAGGAYLPLEPTYPQERLAFMLDDAQVSTLLTHERLLVKLTEPGAPEQGRRMVCLDTDWAVIARENEEKPCSGVTAENLAYVMYTSGSTGTPKGVAVCHRSVMRLLFGVDYIPLGPDQSILQMAPISFDASTFELWGAILHGARCVLFPGRIPTIETLRAALQEYDISTLWLTASLFNLVIDEAPEILSGIQQLLIGGEALSVDHVRRGLELLPRTQIINGYGPTESTTFTCCYSIPRELNPSWRSIPIGRPIGNTQVYLLDRKLQPVPVGVAGELTIGGAGLARGYLNRSELTAEKFIRDPFSHEPGARLYKTGDLARYLPDGNIEFLGRLDHQVKIRGFRIEPGEIEAVLGQHPAVQQAVVLAREDVPGNRRLVAYVVLDRQAYATRNTKPETSNLHTELRGFLQQKLPESMVPSIFVELATLPMTPNGKVDRRALSAPEGGRPESKTGFVAPRDELEQQLVSIWRNVLRCRSVGVRDNFFELGGHSLLSVQLLAQIEHELGKVVPLATFFQGPTIAQLAKVLRREEQPRGYSLLFPIQPAGSKRPFFFIAGAGGNEENLILGYGRLARYLGAEQPFYGLKARGTDGEAAVQTQAREMATDLISAIRGVQPGGPYLLGGGCIGGVLAFEIAQQLTARGEEAALLVLMETRRPTRTIYWRFWARALRSAFTHKWRIMRYVVQRLLYHVRQLPQLGVRRSLNYVFDKARQISKLGHDNKVWRETMWARRYQETLYRYTPHPYPGKLTLLVAEEALHSDPTLGWEGLAVSGIEVHKVPGDHKTHIEKHLQATAERLRACLDAAQASG